MFEVGDMREDRREHVSGRGQRTSW